MSSGNTDYVYVYELHISIYIYIFAEVWSLPNIPYEIVTVLTFKKFYLSQHNHSHRMLTVFRALSTKTCDFAGRRVQCARTWCVVLGCVCAEFLHTCVPWLIHIRAKTCLYAYYDSFVCMPWLIHMHAITHSYVCHDSFIYVPRLICVRTMTHLYVCHDSFICVPWLIHMHAITHSYVCHDSFMCVPRLIRMRAKNYSYAYHDLFVCVIWTIHICDISHGVASVSMIDKITVLFCKRALQKRQYSAKETYNLIDPTHTWHMIWGGYS